MNQETNNKQTTQTNNPVVMKSAEIIFVKGNRQNPRFHLKKLLLLLVINVPPP